MIRFPCPHCGAKLQVSEAHAGTQGRCPQCKGRTAVPPVPATLPPIATGKASRATDAPRDLCDAALLDLPPASAPPAPPPGEQADDATSLQGKTSRPVLGVLLYPMNLSGIIHLLIFSLLPPLWAQALTLDFWMAPGIGPLFWLTVLTLYFLHYAAACLSDSAQGGTRAADINSDSTPLSVDALLSTGETILPVVVSVWGPPLAYYFIKGQADGFFAAWMATVGLVFPMTVLSVNYFDSVRGVNPVLVLSFIASVPGPYGVLVVCLVVLTGLAGLLMHLSGGPHGVWVARPAFIYVLLVEVHLLGRFYGRYQERLNWGT
jgi:hypothetical protein